MRPFASTISRYVATLEDILEDIDDSLSKNRQEGAARWPLARKRGTVELLALFASGFMSRRAAMAVRAQWSRARSTPAAPGPARTAAQCWSTSDLNQVPRGHIP